VLMTLSKSRACILLAFVGIIPLLPQENSKQAAQDERQKLREVRDES